MLACVACVLAACHLCMGMSVVVLSSPPEGMIGAYGPPYMPMQGPHEGLLSVAPMPPLHLGGPPLAAHHLQQGMPYPGMPHPGKETPSSPGHTSSSCRRGLPGPQCSPVGLWATWGAGCSAGHPSPFPSDALTRLLILFSFPTLKQKQHSPGKRGHMHVKNNKGMFDR